MWRKNNDNNRFPTCVNRPKKNIHNSLSVLISHLSTKHSRSFKVNIGLGVDICDGSSSEDFQKSCGICKKFEKVQRRRLFINMWLTFSSVVLLVYWEKYLQTSKQVEYLLDVKSGPLNGRYCITFSGIQKAMHLLG